VLRLPRLRVERPTTVEGAIERLVQLGGRGRVLAGGTDLLPNRKHRLVEAEALVSLDAIPSLRGLRVEADGGLTLGAACSLHEVSSSAEVRAKAPVLAAAAVQVSSPQLRRMGTLGGNVLLDTRCRWYNQSLFWRRSLGFCLKKDGTVCHVVQGGKRCVAAASADTAPALLTLDARLQLVGPDGARTLPLSELYWADGAAHLSLRPHELLVSVRLPPPPPGLRGAYEKLRSREAIDFPLLGVAVSLARDGAKVTHAAAAAVALQARPLALPGVARLVGLERGTPATHEALEAVLAEAGRRLQPLPNVPGDAAWRRELVPVIVRRALTAAWEAP